MQGSQMCTHPAADSTSTTTAAECSSAAPNAEQRAFFDGISASNSPISDAETPKMSGADCGKKGEKWGGNCIKNEGKRLKNDG
jgi:hypothetical protein